jgi:hypothetical protein
MMNDPHVRALIYTVKHSPSVDYERAAALDHDQPRFSARIENSEATITLKEHHSTAATARAIVEPFLRTWEYAADLFDAGDQFRFEFKSADIVDRNPIPGAIFVESVAAVTSTMSVSAHVGRSKYPDPPVGMSSDEDVELMFDCYRQLRQGRRTLADSTYFCLTIIERMAGNRRSAATHFGIEDAVLRKVGDLTANKGGKEARKAKGAKIDLTGPERHWLEATLKVLLRRAAERAAGSVRGMISMADLPSL